MARDGTWRGLWLRLLLSLLIATAFVAVLIKQIDFVPADLSVPAWVVPAYLGSLALYFATRAGRWYFLVRPLGEVRWTTTVVAALGGFMWIMLLPFRLGELARPLFLAQHSEIGASRLFGTVAIERVVDGLVVCGMFFLSFAVVSVAPDAPRVGWIYGISIVVTGAFTFALLVLAAMARWPGAMGTLVRTTIGLIVPSVANTLAGLARGISEGLAALPSVRPLLAFVGVTLVYWLINVAGTWLLAVGCGLDVDPMQTMAIVAVINIVLLVPGGPAQVGNFQGGAFAGLLLFLAAPAVEDRGSVFIFYLYTCQLGMTVVLGLWAQRRLDLDWRAVLGLSKPAKEAERG